MIRYIIIAVGIALVSGILSAIISSETLETVMLSIFGISLLSGFVMLFVDKR